MRCTECKTELPEGSRFCPYCGAPLTGMRHQIPNSTSQPGGQQTTRTGYKHPSGNPVLTFQNKSTGVSFKMIRVDGGTFYFGVTPKEAKKMMSEGVDWRKKYPLVTLNSYYIGETVVTQALWKAVMNKSSVTQAFWQSSLGDLNNPSRFKGDNLPVENVSWNNCQEFIARLNYLLGFRFRLPTEAEWEFASKGGNKSKGYEFSGGNDLKDIAWILDTSLISEFSGRTKLPHEYFCCENTREQEWNNRINSLRIKATTQPVRTKCANELGLYDLNGNVWEWCDWGMPFPTNYHQVKPLRGYSVIWDGHTMEKFPSYRYVEDASLRNPALYDDGRDRQWLYDDYGKVLKPWNYDAFGFRLAMSLE